MSIEHMTLVWKHSKKGGTALLLLLAIADFANDDGVAWPSLATPSRASQESPIPAVSSLCWRPMELRPRPWNSVTTRPSTSSDSGGLSRA